MTKHPIIDIQEKNINTVVVIIHIPRVIILKMNVQSCVQFQYVFSNIHSELYSQVVALIMKPIPKHNEQLKQIVTQFLNGLIGQANSHVLNPNIVHPLHDYNVYQRLHQLMNTSIYPVIGYPQNENHGRSMSRVHDMLLLLNTYHIPITQHIKFVDIGCSMGEITKEFARVLDTSYGVGIDVLHHSQVIHKNYYDNQPAFKYICIDSKCTKLPFENASQDIVTAIMSLHHIQYVDAYLMEIHRVLKPGGVFIIQEHNPQTPDDCIALDILHGLYSMVWAPMGYQEQPFFCNVYDANYLSKQTLQCQLSELGFEVHIPKLNYKAIPKYNPSHNYWLIGIKNV